LSPRVPIGALPLDPTGGLTPRSPGPAPHRVNPLICKILDTPMPAAYGFRDDRRCRQGGATQPFQFAKSHFMYLHAPSPQGGRHFIPGRSTTDRQFSALVMSRSTRNDSGTEISAATEKFPLPWPPKTFPVLIRRTYSENTHSAILRVA